MHLERLIRLNDDFDDLVGVVKLGVTPLGVTITAVIVFCVFMMIVAPTASWSVAAAMAGLFTTAGAQALKRLRRAEPS